MQRFIFISDLHIGLKGKLQSFDEESEKKLESSMREWGKTSAHLVLLGDVFDLLQIQDEEELEKKQIRDIGLGYTLETEARKVRQSLTQFSGVCDGFNEFLNGNEENLITYVYGNHDHAFINKQVQDALLEYIDEPNRQRFNFAFYLEDSRAGFYAEHGNQLEPVNCFLDPEKFEPECPGSIFVLLYWNKIKLKLGDVDALEPWYGIFSYLWKRHRKSQGGIDSAAQIPDDILTATKLYMEYRGRRDVATPVKLEREAILGENLPEVYPLPIIPGLPDQLLHPIPGIGCLFSLDMETEQEYKELFRQDETFRKSVRNLYEKLHKSKMPIGYTELLYQKQEQAGPVMGLGRSIAGAVMHVTFGKVREKLNTIHDPFLSRVRSWYEKDKTCSYPLKDYDQVPEPLCKRTLDSSVHSHVILGHTHFAIHGTPLPLGNGNTILYHNTGTWKYFVNSSQEINKRLTYLEITIDKEPVYKMKEVI